MATITLYRPIGTAELALIEAACWLAFPEMPSGFKFYAYTQPPTDVLLWREWEQDRTSDQFMYPEVGQGEVVESWLAWGNSPIVAFVVSFELDEKSPLRQTGWCDGSYEVGKINAALVGPISLYETQAAEE